VLTSVLERERPATPALRKGAMFPAASSYGAGAWILQQSYDYPLEHTRPAQASAHVLEATCGTRGRSCGACHRSLVALRVSRF